MSAGAEKARVGSHDQEQIYLVGLHCIGQFPQRLGLVYRFHFKGVGVVDGFAYIVQDCVHGMS